MSQHTPRSSLSLSISKPTTAPVGNTAASGRPHSHHRRKSSVSTRRESQEIMGLALAPEDDDSASCEEIRKRALLALEGRDGFSRVEIPDWKTPSVEQQTFEWESPSHPISSASSKRDSFGRSLMSASISNKDQLHTLVEEEEDEEENASGVRAKELSLPSTQITGPTPRKPRPASLQLRGLSLVGESALPKNSTSPLKSAGGMRPLSLLGSAASERRKSLNLTPTLVGVWPTDNDSPSRSTSSPRTPSPTTSPLTSQRLSTNSQDNYVPSPLSEAYSPHQHSLSTASSSGRSERPVSPIEVFANHTYSIHAQASLLDRIATLEEALAMARSSDAHARSLSNDESKEELIALVGSLKSSRDDLHSQVSTLSQQLTQEKEAFGHKEESLRRRTEKARKETRTVQERLDQTEKQRAQTQHEMSDAKASLAFAEKALADAVREHQHLEQALNHQISDLSQKVITLQAERDEALKRAHAQSESARGGVFGGGSSHSQSDSTESLARYEEESTGFGRYVEDMMTAGDEEYMDELDSDPSDLDDDEVGETQVISSRLRIIPIEATSSVDLETDRPRLQSRTLPTDGAIERPSSALSSATTTKAPIQHAPTHSRTTSMVRKWKFPAAPSTRMSRRKPSVVDPFRVDDTSFEDLPQNDEDRLPVPDLLANHKRKSKTKVEVTPALENGFALNFGIDDAEDVPYFSFGQDGQLHSSDAPVNQTEKSSIAVKHPSSQDPLVPPSAEPADFKLARIYPLVAREVQRPPQAVTVLPSPTTRSARQAEGSYGSTPSSTSTATRSSFSQRFDTSSQSSLSSSNNSFSISGKSSPFPTGVRNTHRPSLEPAIKYPSYEGQSGDASLSPTSAKFAVEMEASRNVGRLNPQTEKKDASHNDSTIKVAFPTVSPQFERTLPSSQPSNTGGWSSTFGLSSLASYIPWSPRIQRHPAPNINALFQPASPSLTRSNSGSVDPDIMRERLRARLVQEGKLKSDASGSNNRTLMH